MAEPLTIAAGAALFLWLRSKKVGPGVPELKAGQFAVPMKPMKPMDNCSPLARSLYSLKFGGDRNPPGCPVLRPPASPASAPVVVAPVPVILPVVPTSPSVINPPVMVPVQATPQPAPQPVPLLPVPPPKAPPPTETLVCPAGFMPGEKGCVQISFKPAPPIIAPIIAPVVAPSTAARESMAGKIIAMLQAGDTSQARFWLNWSDQNFSTKDAFWIQGEAASAKIKIEAARAALTSPKVAGAIVGTGLGGVGAYTVSGLTALNGGFWDTLQDATCAAFQRNKSIVSKNVKGACASATSKLRGKGDSMNCGPDGRGPCESSTNTDYEKLKDDAEREAFRSCMRSGPGVVDSALNQLFCGKKSGGGAAPPNSGDAAMSGTTTALLVGAGLLALKVLA